MARLLSAMFCIPLSACASTVPLTIYDDLPEGSPKGYIEFYCSPCIPNLAIYRVQDSKEVHLANLVTGSTISGAIRSPYRMKRLRIAQEPGDFEYVIRLQSPVIEGSTSDRIRVKVMRDALSPVGVTSRPQTHMTFKWGAYVGDPLPLTASPNAFESLAAALSDSYWGTRWYAAEALGLIGTEVDNAVLTRLSELTSKKEYRRCLETESTLKCSLVREQASRVLKMLKKGNP